MRTKKIRYLQQMAICLAVFSALMLGIFSDAQAQASAGRITQNMKAVSAHELLAGKYPIRLWGVTGADGFNVYALKALQKLEQYTKEGEITCRLIAKERSVYFGKCFAISGEDISLAMVQDGLASVDRKVVTNDGAAKTYLAAENKAALLGKGIWADVALVNVVESMDGSGGGIIGQDQIILMSVIIVGFLVIGFVIRSGFKSIGKRHQKEQEEAIEREDSLHDRERGVLISAMIGELDENKAKIEAFMRIYEAQLEDVADQSKKPKYQQSGGDSVAQYPVLNHTVFEGNSARLSLLGMKMAGDVSRIYSMFHKEAEYINLEADMPQHQAVDIVTRIVSDARSLLPQIDQLAAQLKEAR